MPGLTHAQTRDVNRRRRVAGAGRRRVAITGVYDKIVNPAASDCGCASGDLGSFYFRTSVGYAFFL